MDLQTALQKLEALGTEENRQACARRGVAGPLFGVGAADLEGLVKETNIDHALARELWGTGNHDARMLAAMIADPLQVDAALLEAWCADLGNAELTETLAGLAARTPLSLAQVDVWCASDQEWTGQLGWTLVGRMARDDGAYPDDYFDAKLEVIEREIHARKNRARHAMNQALIDIALRSANLREKALAVAERVGRVWVDHGDTGGHTPDAAEIIRRTVAASAPAVVAVPVPAPALRPKRAQAVRPARRAKPPKRLASKSRKRKAAKRAKPGKGKKKTVRRPAAPKRKAKGKKPAPRKKARSGSAARKPRRGKRKR